MPAKAETFNCLMTIFNTVLAGLISWAVAKKMLTKQRRIDAKSDLKRLIESITSTAISYWQTSGRNKIVERKITYKLKRLTSEINSLYCKDKLFFKSIEEKNKAFRRKITGGQFENEDRVAEDGTANHIGELSEELIALITSKK